MKLTQFPEYLGWMSRACQALFQAKKANDQGNVPAYREELQNALKYEALAKRVDENAPIEKEKSAS
jgi:hypothetical protein